MEVQTHTDQCSKVQISDPVQVAVVAVKGLSVPAGK